MAKATREGVELLDDGRVRLVMDGTVRTLRRPKIGELRTLFTSIQAVGSKDKPASGDVGAFDGADEVAAWWREVVDTLGDGDPLPSDTDDLPVWILSGNLISKVAAHWREVPYLSGG
jgi:hypothetical protein